MLEVRLGDIGSDSDASEFSAVVERGFKELLDRIGIPILCNGVTERCISSSIQEVRDKQDSGGYTARADTRVEMLATDFDSFGSIMLNETEVTINELVMVIRETKRDPQDPVIYFEVSSGY